MNYNKQLAGISESFTIAFADRVRRLKAQGVPVIGLQTGDPDFLTPEPVLKAAHRALEAGETHYSNSRGLPALRRAVADNLADRYGVTYDPDREILITHGAIHAYYSGLQAILNPGEQVLIADPSWQTHANMVRVLRGRPVRVPASPDNRFLPDISTWEQHLTPETKALVINYPNNPTGTVAPKAYQEKLRDFAREHNLYVVSDEVYHRLNYTDQPHTCFAALDDAQSHTLLVNSFSKTYAMTGWRIGYLAAPEAIIDQALKASQHSITNVAAFIQHGAVAALTHPDAEHAVQEMILRYTQRRAAVLDLWQQQDTRIHLEPPAGAFYFFIDMRAYGLSARELSERLLNEAHVALVPGSVYGESGEGFLRMTTAASDDDVINGFQALMDWAASI